MPKLQARANKMFIGVQMFSTSQGQTSIVLYSTQVFPQLFSKIQLVSRLPPLRYRSGLSDPPKAVAPRSVRCINPNLQLTFQTGEIKKGTDLVFKPHVFLSFGKVQFQQTKIKKMPKLSVHANQILIGVPILKHETGTDLTNFYFPSLFKDE